ncbi:MAG: translation elongation factor Ts [Pseudomonadota bacterium]
MAIPATLVKELRERTGAGMMECKKALEEAAGDIEAAIEQMRKSGQAKAAKKAGRIAAEGVVLIRVSGDGRCAVILEVNCETDFVAKDGNFQGFATAAADRLLAAEVADVEALGALPIRDGEATTVEEARQAVIQKIGENVAIRRFTRLTVKTPSAIASYRHGSRIGVLVEYQGSEAVGRDIAMHVAASNPVCVNASEVSADLLAKEREIFLAQARETGKPENLLEKMVDGRVRKYLAEVTLLGQPFVKDPNLTVEQLLAQTQSQVVRFVRFEVGEGIEKKVANFAEEVMAAQVRA